MSCASFVVLREAKPMMGNMSQLPPLQPITKHTLQKTTTTKTANGVVVQDTVTTGMKEILIKPGPIETKCQEEIYITTAASTSVGTNTNIISNNNNTNNSGANDVQVIVDDKRRRNQDLNKCLQEAVDAIFADDEPPVTFSNKSVTKNQPDEPVVSVTEVKVEPKVEQVNGSVTNTMFEPPPPVVNGEVSKPLPNPGDPNQMTLDDFDPMKVLEWKDGIGTLPGSNLKVSFYFFPPYIIIRSMKQMTSFGFYI